MYRILLLSFIFLTFTSCITTEGMKRKQEVENLSLQVTQGQKISTDTIVKIQKLEEEIAQLSGRLEEKGYQNRVEGQEGLSLINKKLELLEEKQSRQSTELQELKKLVSEQSQFISKVTSILEKMGPSTKSSLTPGNKNQGSSSSYKVAMSDYRKGHYSKAKGALENLIQAKKLKGTQLANTLHNLGMIYYMEKKYDNALVYFSKLYSEFPTSTFSSNGLLYLGKSFQKKNQIDDAKSSYEQLIQSFPSSKHAAQAKKILESL